MVGEEGRGLKEELNLKENDRVWGWNEDCFQKGKR